MWNKNRDGYIVDYDGDEPELITVYYNDNVYDIIKGELRFNNILDLIQREDFSVIPDFLDNKKIMDSIDSVSSDFSVKNGVLYIQGDIVPIHLQSVILSFYHNNLDFQGLVNFWKNLKNNKNQEVRAELFSFIKKDGHFIMPDGSFIAYRTVNSDFSDIYTGTVLNKIGDVISIDKEKVDSNKHNMAGYGLHIATMKKAILFGNWTPSNSIRLLAVKVNPEDVVVCVDNSELGYFRVCKYEIIKEIKKENVQMSELLTKEVA